MEHPEKSMFNFYYTLEDHLIRVKLNSMFFKVFREPNKLLFPLRESGFQLVLNALMLDRQRISTF